MPSSQEPTLISLGEIGSLVVQSFLWVILINRTNILIYGQNKYQTVLENIRLASIPAFPTVISAYSLSRHDCSLLLSGYEAPASIFLVCVAFSLDPFLASSQLLVLIHILASFHLHIFVWSCVPKVSSLAH